MTKNILVGASSLFICSFYGCNNQNDQIEPENITVESKPFIPGVRLAWDHSTLKKVSSDNAGAHYNGYARLIQLESGALLCVYEADGNVLVVRSDDLGKNWSETTLIAAKEGGTNMAVPDLLQLQDRSILVCYNPRPTGNDPLQHFAIRTKKSYDKGATWQDERVLYEAGYQFENGCWEPSAVQLPDGEIQLFFANEGIYKQSNEQNISLLRSTDGGLTWTEEPEVVSFRQGSRDGMPVPLLLKDENEIVVSIEDNGISNFKPYIIRSAMDEDWSQLVDANSPNRTYALKEKLHDDIYAGAPYLGQLKSGKIILSYQGTEGRGNSINFAEMKVVVGSGDAYDFNRKTVPFQIATDRSGLWNSVSVLSDNSVIALTSTNAFSGNGDTEVWMIRGYVIPEMVAQKGDVVVDGKQDESLWQTHFPLFIGHKGETQLRGNFAYDDDFLYIITKVNDPEVVSVADEKNNDAVQVFLDVQNRSYVAPDDSVFNILLTINNFISFKEGENGKWGEEKTESDIQHFTTVNDKGYFQEIGIPWSMVGGKPAVNSRMGISIQLIEKNSNNQIADYHENMSNSEDDKPYSWASVTLK